MPGAEHRPPAPLLVAQRADPGPLLDEAWLANTVFDAHRDGPEFGWRFLADEADGARRQVATLITVKLATSTRIEVGVRDLKNNLSRYLDQVEAGVEVVVTDRGRPIARLSGIADEPTDKLAALIEAGLVRPPTSKVRQRPLPLHASGSVSELVAEQRQ